MYLMLVGQEKIMDSWSLPDYPAMKPASHKATTVPSYILSFFLVYPQKSAQFTQLWIKIKLQTSVFRAYWLCIIMYILIIWIRLRNSRLWNVSHFNLLGFNHIMLMITGYILDKLRFCLFYFYFYCKWNILGLGLLVGHNMPFLWNLNLKVSLQKSRIY